MVNSFCTMSKQEEDVYLAKVKKNGSVLQYLPKQNEAICLAAVKQNPIAFMFVAVQIYEVCYEAAKQCPAMLDFVKDASLVARIEKELGIA